MDYEKIRADLNHDPTLKLIKSQKGAFVISFLHEQFKLTQKISIPQLTIEEKLEDYIEYLKGVYSDLSFQPAKVYLNDWCNSYWLRKTFDTSDEPIFSLTPATEKAMVWIEDLQQKEEFVGTESRFLQILSLLKEIQDRSTVDVEARIAQLERDRDKIQQEIDLIRETGKVETFSQTQLQERFISADQMSRQLMSDFKSVEQNFRDLTRKVQEAQLEAGSRRGTVVGKVIDADEALKVSPQGLSFYTFFRFLMSEEKRQSLKFLIEKVYQLEELQPLAQNYRFLQRIERNLLKAANYIVQSNYRLTEKLRQMLDERNMRENRRVAELIVDVQRLALHIADDAAKDANFWSIEGDPVVQMVMERPLHPLESAEAATFADVDMSELATDVLDGELDELVRQFYVDEGFLAQQVDRALEARASIPLPELIELYPVTKGLPEIVAYVSLATGSVRHSVDPSTIDTVTVASLELDKALRLKLPHVVFSR
ncbi:MAG: DUF3375 domain-containing protein [Cyanobacteria bacterium J06621_3]